jgi:hypothetical protein
VVDSSKRTLVQVRVKHRHPSDNPLQISSDLQARCQHTRPPLLASRRSFCFDDNHILSFPSFRYSSTLYHNHPLHQPFYHLLEAISSPRPRLINTFLQVTSFPFRHQQPPLQPLTSPIKPLWQVIPYNVTNKHNLLPSDHSNTLLSLFGLPLHTFLLCVYFFYLHTFNTRPSSLSIYLSLQNSHIFSSKSLSVGLLGYLNSFLDNHLSLFRQLNQQFISYTSATTYK